MSVCLIERTTRSHLYTRAVTGLPLPLASSSEQSPRPKPTALCANTTCRCSDQSRRAISTPCARSSSGSGRPRTTFAPYATIDTYYCYTLIDSPHGRTSLGRRIHNDRRTEHESEVYTERRVLGALYMRSASGSDSSTRARGS